MNNENIKSKYSLPFRIRVVVLGIIGWLIVASLPLSGVKHNFTDELAELFFIITLMYFLFLAGNKLTITDNNIFITNSRYFLHEIAISRGDIHHVTISKSLGADKMVFHYGQNEKAVTFPDNTDTIIEWLCKNNINVCKK